MSKIFISNNKDIGVECKSWAISNTPNGYHIVDDPNDCDIFLSVQYDKILSKKFLDSRRAYNFHPNLLPKYGGVGTLTQCILNGENFSGITLHKIDSGVDTGSIIEVEKIPIVNDETAYSLHLKTSKVLYDMFKRRYVDLLTQNYTTTNQKNDGRKTYTYKELDGLFDITTLLRSTYYPGKPGVFYYDKNNNKVEVSWEAKINEDEKN